LFGRRKRKNTHRRLGAIGNWQSAIGDSSYDLARDEQEFVLCCGGAGGKGNVHFKSSRNRAPRQYTEGEEGEQGNFLLEFANYRRRGIGWVSECR